MAYTTGTGTGTSMTENERFGLVSAKTESINSGTGDNGQILPHGNNPMGF